MLPEKRRFRDLVSVGPKMERDFELLGIHGVPQLARQDPHRMYEKLCSLTGQRQDPCVLDVFCAAVAQARDPRLPEEQRQWWYWSRRRKGNSGR
jgi:Pathogenicity locus